MTILIYMISDMWLGILFRTVILQIVQEIEYLEDHVVRRLTARMASRSVLRSTFVAI